MLTGRSPAVKSPHMLHRENSRSPKGGPGPRRGLAAEETELGGVWRTLRIEQRLRLSTQGCLLVPRLCPDTSPEVQSKGRTSCLGVGAGRRGQRPSQARGCSMTTLNSQVLPPAHRGRPQTTSTRLYAGGELQGSPVAWKPGSQPAGEKRGVAVATKQQQQLSNNIHCGPWQTGLQ